MRYASARIEQEDREFAYRLYVTESLRLQGESKYLSVKYSDLFEKKVEQSGEEVIKNVVSELGLKFGGD